MCNECACGVLNYIKNEEWWPQGINFYFIWSSDLYEEYLLQTTSQLSEKDKVSLEDILKSLCSALWGSHEPPHPKQLLRTGQERKYSEGKSAEVSCLCPSRRSQRSTAAPLLCYTYFLANRTQQKHIVNTTLPVWQWGNSAGQHHV